MTRVSNNTWVAKLTRREVATIADDEDADDVVRVGLRALDAELKAERRLAVHLATKRH